MRSLHSITLAGFFFIPFCTHALSGLTFAHKDWELACDNTNTCRAAGYGDEVSVLLTRRAGILPHTRIEVTFAQREQGQPPVTAAALFINGQKEGALIPVLDGYFSLDRDIRSLFINALRRNDTIEFSANGERKTLSLAGSNAVLLKMDEYQKRIHTESALLHPGPDDSAKTLPFSPAPVIATQPVIPSPEITPLTETQLQKIRSQLQVTAPEMNCSELREDEKRIYYAIPVDKNHTLIQTECFDTSRYAMWLTDATLTAPAQLITNDANEYENGEIRKFSEPIQFWRWTGKQFALTDEYRSGGRDLSIGGVWTLPQFVSHVRTQQDIDSDNAALESLSNAIKKEKAANPELDLKKIADQFPLTGQVTDFTIHYDDEQGAPLSAQKPSADISDDEWQAFTQSSVGAVSENGETDYKLVDVDGDGKRDLIINSFAGGTGLVSYTGLLKRGDKAFYAIDNTDDENLDVAGALFSETGRGANQWSQWVRINGLVYALWYNGQFGEDNLYLLRPFSNAGNVPVVTVRYRYALDIKNTPDEKQPAISDKDRSRLLKDLDRMQEYLIKDQPTGKPPEAICPILPGTSAEDAENYRYGEPLHYAFENVALIPVWLNNKCYIGTVASHHGYYHEGIDAEISLTSPRKEKNFLTGYTLTGKRHVTKIQSGWKLRKGDLGVM